MKALQILSNIDRRIIYLLLAIAVITPMIVELEMPIAPDDYAQTAYNSISNTFKEPNKRILLSFDYGPSTEPELGPMSFAIMKQVLLTDNEVHLVALFPTGLGMITQTIDRVKKDSLLLESNINLNKRIVQLGYAPGGEAVIKGMLSDIPKIFPKVKDSIKNLCDYDFIVSFSAGSPGSKEWVQFAGDQSEAACNGKKINVTTGVTAVQVTELLPYVNNGQLKGILAGLSGAASYESLVGDFGPASKNMTPQSFAHLLIVILIIIGNITYIIKRKEDR
ncbi:MAG: hypothetical protein CMG00_05265 [Candidatus Marinimicrobia bacterium]|nr:hypothetical protein [Candidatus Neomarinimicrobiota bacterium]|tara:strand:- start:871 stop:1704 length:834 start_codon:yes stop_codon:yes gene_type:complete